MSVSNIQRHMADPLQNQSLRHQYLVQIRWGFNTGRPFTSRFRRTESRKENQTMNPNHITAEPIVRVHSIEDDRRIEFKHGG